jgi:UDP-glucose 4-epimerase
VRVVVTGATGNLGTSVVEALAADPSIDEVVGLARRRPDWSMPKVTFTEADIRSADLAEVFVSADAVVHLAWIFQPTHRPLTTWELNVLGGIRVFEAAAAAGVANLVYASSIGAYSPAPGRRVDETWPTHGLPTAAYGREKAYLERYLDGFEPRHEATRVVRLRPCFAFKRQSASEQRRIFAGPLLPRGVVRPGRLPVLPVPDGVQFQAIHTSDVAEAFRLAVVSDVRGAFNVAAEPVIDRTVLGELLETRPVRVPPAAVKAALAAAWRMRLAPAGGALFDMLLGLPILNTDRARRELGWAPRHTGVEALREMLAGLAEGAGMSTPPLRADRPPRQHQV